MRAVLVVRLDGIRAVSPGWASCMPPPPFGPHPRALRQAATHRNDRRRAAMSLIATERPTTDFARSGTAASASVRADADELLDAAEAAEHLDAIAELIDRGNPRAARQRTSWLTSRIDADARELLVQCLQALEAPGPKSRSARLNHLLAQTTPVTRALVVACMPRTDPSRGTPTPATAKRTVDQAPRDQATRHVTPSGPRRTAREASTLRAAARYFEHVAESGHGQDDSDDDVREGLPYDRVDDADFAVAPLRGTGCVACFTERPISDQRRRPDDGLCEQCLESGRPGIPAPQRPRTRAEAVVARCRFLTDRAGSPATAVALMRREWRAASLRDRVVIVEWVQGQPSLAAAAGC